LRLILNTDESIVGGSRSVSTAWFARVPAVGRRVNAGEPEDVQNVRVSGVCDAPYTVFSEAVTSGAAER